MGIHWNASHMLDNDVQALSYSREQLAGQIEKARDLGSRYVRAPWQFNSYYRSPGTVYSGNLLEWYCYTCFQAGVIPMFDCYGHPVTSQTNWEALIPADNRYRHVNKPEPEHQSLVLDGYRDMLDRIARECTRAGISQSLVPIQNGNELGKGGACQWSPYADQDPANPEEASPDGRVPASVVTFRSALLEVIREYDFIAVAPAMEAQDTTIMQTEIDSPGWKTVLTAHDKIAFHSYPDPFGTDFNRAYASKQAATAYNARKAILDSNGITLPIWVTEIGWTQTDCVPTGTNIAEIMAVTCSRLGAEEVFAFTTVMNGNNFAAYTKDQLTGTNATWPG